MIKLFSLFLALTTLGWSAGPQFNNFVSHYAVSGVPNTTIVTVNTGLGSGYGCVMFLFYRLGTVNTPTCGGHNMTQAGGTTVLAASGVTSTRWVYFGGGIVPGSITVTGSTTGGTDCQINVIIVDGAGTSQPDAAPTATTGVFLPVSGGQEAAMSITTVAANSLVLGEYNSTVSVNATPSSNGTFIAVDGSGFGVYYWYSTVNPAAGAYNLKGMSGSNTGSAYIADGLSIAPPSSGVTANPSVFGVAIQ